MKNKRRRGQPRPSPSVLERINPNAAGIDCGSMAHYVVVPPDRDPTPVQSFKTLTSDLRRLADWLTTCGVTSVAMEATGVYWIPIYEILEARGFEVRLVNARHVKNVPGRKSDVADCEWLRELNIVGLLRGSFRPSDAIVALRAYLRHRQTLLESAGMYSQRMQRALLQMKLQLPGVVSDITGVTGLRILRDVVAGQRDPHRLAAHRDHRCHASPADIVAALTGNYRPEHLFVLQQNLELFDTCQHYPTYGYSAWYNPWTGSYGRAATVYGPYGGAGVGARYNPSTGTYARGAAAWGPYGGAAVGQAYNPRTGTVARGGVAAGPYGARGAAEAYNPRTGAYGATRQGSSAYGSWGSTSVQRGDQWANTQRTTNNATGVTTRTTQSSAGSSASVSGPGGRSSVAQSNSGDLYAGHDGNVYKKSDSGSWQKYDNGGWNSVDKPTATPQQREQAQNRATQAGAQAREKAGAAGYDPSQLNRDAASRSEGAQRTRDLGSVRSGSAGSRAGSYRPSGGGGRRR